MSSIGTGYDLSASTFSPDGRIFQVDYAQKAVDATGTAVGLRGKDGVVLAVEKLVPTDLHCEGANSRICDIDAHIGVASAGVYPDARALAQRAREEAGDYYTTYRVRIPPNHLADRLAMYAHAYTLYSAVRPFGASVLLAGLDPDSKAPRLHCVEPSGTCYGYFGAAIGKARQAARTEIEKLKLNEMTMEELVTEAAKIIYTVRDETKDKNFELELSWVGKHTDGRHQLVPTDVRAKAIEAAEKSVTEDSDDDE